MPTKTHSGFFKLLSSPTRVRILRLLLDHDDLTVDNLASHLEVSVPTISRHLQLLRIQDLVTFKQDAQTRYYHVNKEEVIRGIGSFLDDLGITLTQSPVAMSLQNAISGRRRPSISP
jgi:ArsR family transcriptional regulator